MKPTLGVVGAGKVGRALARLCFQVGYDVRSVYSRTPEHAALLAQHVGAQVVVKPADLDADLTLLTVPDDAIAAAADDFAVGDWHGRAVIHTSGAHDASVLAPLVRHDAMVGSLHPAYPFADSANADLSGVTFAIEAQANTLREWLLDMVSAFGGLPLMISPGQKSLYHAALVFASNYTVTLFAIAEGLLKDLGADEQTARQALYALVGGTVSNLRLKGVPDALTGPLVRGDVGTIAAHLDALRERPDLLDAYVMLARLSFPMLAARGVPTAPIETTLKQDTSWHG